MHAGERLCVETPGGGGYGDPLARAVSAVVQDVRDRRVSLQMARERYGVVLHEPDLSVDEAATQQLRRTLGAQRGRITWVYDRGPLGRAERIIGMPQDESHEAGAEARLFQRRQ